MLHNRSVPVDTLLAHLTYTNVLSAMEWLSRTFGFSEHFRYGNSGGDVEGAQMHLGAAWIMLNRTREGRCSPSQAGCCTQSLTVFVEDVDAHYSKSKLEGAEIMEELNQTPYGERQYAALDLDGHRWLFSCHVADVFPSDWGATTRTT